MAGFTMLQEQYEPTGNALSIRTLIAKSSITSTELSNFMEWVTRGDVEINDDLFAQPSFLPYALAHSCFKTFLIDYGYITEKLQDVWVPPKVGDCFRTVGNQTIYMYVRTEAYKRAMICLSGPDKGSRLSEAVTISANTEVSKEGFERIIGDRSIEDIVPINLTTISEDRHDTTRTTDAGTPGLGSGVGGGLGTGVGGTVYSPPAGK